VKICALARKRASASDDLAFNSNRLWYISRRQNLTSVLRKQVQSDVETLVAPIPRHDEIDRQRYPYGGVR